MFNTALNKILRVFKIKKTRSKVLYGFTLIEIMITISIISLLTASVLPSIGSFSDANVLAQAAQNVASDIENAKFKALAGSIETISGVEYKHWGFTCPDAPSSTYTLMSFQDNASYTPAPSTNRRQVTLTGGVLVECSTLTPIKFRRLGGTTINNDTITIIVSKSGYSKEIQIDVNSNGIIGIKKL